MGLTNHLAIGVLFFTVSSAHSYMPEEHGSVIEIAFLDLQSCLEEPVDREAKRSIFSGNLTEDTNYFRKAFKFSHFYNPKREIDAKWGPKKRKTSDERVQMLQDRLEDASERYLNSKRGWRRLGNMVHHIQDMAVPAHVIPVNHPVISMMFHEPMEHYKGRERLSEELRKEEPNCDLLQSKQTPVEILISTAKDTLNKIESGGVYIEGESGSLKYIPWTEFWNDDSVNGKGFGEYGPWAQHFGRSKFLDESGEMFSIDTSQYDDFYLQRLRVAREATLKTLAWYFQMIGLIPAR